MAARVPIACGRWLPRVSAIRHANQVTRPCSSAGSQQCVSAPGRTFTSSSYVCKLSGHSTPVAQAADGPLASRSPTSRSGVNSTVLAEDVASHHSTSSWWAPFAIVREPSDTMTMPSMLSQYHSFPLTALPSLDPLRTSIADALLCAACRLRRPALSFIASLWRTSGLLASTTVW